jgi:hypothetical protein
MPEKFDFKRDVLAEPVSRKRSSGSVDLEIVQRRLDMVQGGLVQLSAYFNALAAMIFEKTDFDITEFKQRANAFMRAVDGVSESK